MDELEQKYQQKRDLLNNLKDMFYSNPPKFKKYFHEQNINNQARTLAFIQVNDSEFYKDVKDYVGGVKI